MSLPKYPHYKPSGVQWLGDVPAHWEVSALRRVVYFQRGHDLPSDQREEGDIPVVSSGGVTGTHSKAVASAPGIVTGRYGSIGNFSFIETDYWPLNTALYSIDLFGNSPRWAWYMLQSISEHFVLNSLKAAVPGVDRNDIHVVAVTVPSIAEQTAIAHFLDHETAKIDALIAEQEKLIHLLAEKRQATISHAVTRGLNPDAPMKDSGVAWLGEVPAHWDIKSIKRISPVQRGASPRPIDDPKYFDDEGEYSWVRIADVSSSDGFLRETTQKLSELGSSLSVRMEPNQLFVSIAGTVGKPCITQIKACIHDGFVYFPQLSIEPKFLFRIFEAGACYAGLGKMGTQLNLNTDTIGSIKIAVPPPEEICKLLEFIDYENSKLDTLRAEAERAIALLKERRAALIAAAVTGQIDVRQNSGILNGGEARDAVAALS